MRVRLSLRLAWEHVRAGFGRMALSVVAVALGVALVVAIRLMNGAVLASFLDTVDGVAGRAALTVTAGEGLTFPEAVRDTVAAVPGVRLAVPLVRGVAFPDDGSGELLTVHGVDLTNEAEVRVYHDAADTTEVIHDLEVFLAQPDSIVLGRELADRRGIRIGDRVPLVTPAGVRSFTVRGLLDPQGLAGTLGGRLVVMDLFAAEEAFTAPGQINQIDVLLAPGAGVDAVREAIAAVLPAGLDVAEPALRKDVIRRTVGGFQAMLTAFGLLAVVAGFVVCYSRLGAIFEARTWEVGLLRAVGLRRSVVFVELLKESMLLGLVGTAIGIPIGIVISRLGIRTAATTTALNFRLPNVAPRPALELEALVTGAVVGLSAACLAAIAPALRLSRKEPITALRLHGVEQPASRAPVHAGIAGVLLAAVAALVGWQLRFGGSAIGIVTTALAAIATCALARPLVVVGGGALTRLWQAAFGPTGEFATSQLRQQPRRCALTVATLGVGLGTVLMFGMLAWSFERSLVRALTSRLHVDLVVTSAHVAGGYVGAPFTEDVLDELRTVDGIALATGQQMRDVPFAEKSALVIAIDAPYFTDPRLATWPIDAATGPDALPAVARGEAVLLSRSFAHHHGLGVGDRVALPAPGGEVVLPVAAITSGQPESAILLSRPLYRRLWADRLLSFAFVTLDPGADLAAVERAIARRLGDRHRLRVRPTANLIAFFADQVRQAFSLAYLLELVTLILVSVGIADTLATSALERTREFGLMRAVGLPGGRLFAMVMLEAVTMAVLGLTLAVAAGLLLGSFWVWVQFPAILGWVLDFHFPRGFAATAAAVTLAMCLLAGVPPALRAMRLPVVRALRND